MKISACHRRLMRTGAGVLPCTACCRPHLPRRSADCSVSLTHKPWIVLSTADSSRSKSSDRAAVPASSSPQHHTAGQTAAAPAAAQARQPDTAPGLAIDMRDVSVAVGSGQQRKQVQAIAP